MSSISPKRMALSIPALYGIFWIVSAVFFGSGMSVQFHYDDGTNIGSNVYVHSLHNFWAYFSDARTHSALPENSPYRPLTTLSHAVMWAIGDGATLPFHLLKLFLHAANGVLVFWILQKILGQTLGQRKPNSEKAFQRVSLVVALAFLIHPAQTESVNYISATNTLQSSFFVLCAFALYLEKRFFGMAATFLLGLLTKEEGAAALPLILWHQLLLGERSSKVRGKQAPSLLPALWLLGTFAFFGFIYLQLSRTVQFSLVSRQSYFLTQLRAWIYYLKILVWPHPLSIEKMSFGFSESFLSPGVIPALLFWLAVTIACAWAVFKNRNNSQIRLTVFGIGAYLAALSPASSFFPLSEPINEHRYYLAYAFALPLVGLGITKLIGSLLPAHLLQKTQTVAIGITFALWGGLTLQTSKVWASAEVLWQNAIDHDPNNARLLNNLAVIYLNRGELARALPLYERCVQESPHYLYCHPGLGATYQNLGREAEALTEFKRATELYPQSVYARFAYARALWDLRKDYSGATVQLDACDQISARHYAACLDLRKRMDAASR